MLLWVVAGLGLLFSMLALALGRRLSRRLEALTQSYWELRYDYTRLRSRLARLDPDEPGPSEDAADAPPPSAPALGPGVTFVSLSSIRKKDK